MRRRAQMPSIARTALAGLVAILISFILYATVSISTTDGQPASQACYPQWEANMVTRATLQTQDGSRPVRSKLAQAYAEEGEATASTYLADILPDNSSQHWFWSINGYKDGKPGLTATGSDTATELFETRDPFTYTHEGTTVEITLIALDQDNPCSI